MAKPNFDDLSIHEIMESINKRWFSKTALQIKTRDGWDKLSYVPLGERAVDVSSALLKLGMEKGDRAAILSESRPEWGIALFGIISCGGIVVPMDVKLSEKEIEFILNDSGAKFIFVSDKHLSTMDNLKPKLTNIKNIFLLDETDRTDIVKLKDLKMKEGDKKYLPLGIEDTAIIVYTSGTTGVAKGVELTYKNLIFQAKELNRLVHYTEADNFLSMLPLNHMLEMTGGLLAPLYVGGTITYCDSLKPANIMALMNETRTTVMITVPLVLKIFHDGIIRKAQSLTFLKRQAFFMILHLCRFLLRFKIKMGRSVFRKIHEQFGGRLRCFVSGGAPLDPAVEMNFNAMGFTILQGYGLTETSPVITVNTFEELKYGSVGKPIPGVEVKLMKPDGTFADEGEVVTRGDHVMKGYYKNPEKTAEIIKDGWLHTGDIGRFDRKGFLYITGRIKNMIVLGGGKKVFPEEVEEVISASPYIKEICALGRKAESGLKAGTEEVFAVIVPNLDRFEELEKKDKEAIKKKIGAEISRLSDNLAEYKKISDFMLYFDELPKTSTRKIRRKSVAEMLVGRGADETEAKQDHSEYPGFSEDALTDKVRKIVADTIKAPVGKINPESNLSDDLGVDSLMKVEIVMALEKSEGITLSDKSAYEIKTFSDLVRLVKECKNGKNDERPGTDDEVEKSIRNNVRLDLVHDASYFIFKGMFGLYFRKSLHGIENLPKDKSFIIAANHSSMLDFPLLITCIPFSRMKDVLAPAAKDYFYAKPARRTAVSLLFNTFPFERLGDFIKGLKACERLIAQGKSLILFPEGTRNQEGGLLPFKPGLGLLAYDLKVPVVPVYIKGAFEALPKGRLFPYPKKIEIFFGKPVDVKKIDLSGSKSDYEKYLKISEEVFKEVKRLKNGR